MATLPSNRALVGSLISAVASVAVALVGILPQLWAKDQFNRIDPFLPANRDLLTIIEWMDMGTQYSNTVGQ